MKKAICFVPLCVVALLCVPLMLLAEIPTLTWDLMYGDDYAERMHDWVRERFSRIVRWVRA